MKAKTAGSLLAACLAAAAAAQDPSPSPSPALVLDRFTWDKEVDGPAPIRAVEVRNDYGDVRARFAGDRRLELHAVIQRLGVPPGVGVTVERRGDVIALLVAYPPGRIQDAEPEPPKDSYDRLDLVVFVPAGVAFSGHTLRGMVEVRGLESDVRAATRQGPIEVRTTGAIEARSQSGNIAASVSATSPGPFLFLSEAGSIRVTLPPQKGGADRLTRGRTEVAGHLASGGAFLFATSAKGNVEIQ